MNLSNHEDETVRRVLGKLPARLVAFMEGRGVKVHVLAPGETFTTASASLLRLGIGLDAWPVQPAGLFVVDERTVYLRRLDGLTFAHELGHALDCALGNGFYLSGYDAAIQKEFRTASAFVTPYAAMGPDEFFAECFRAYVEENSENVPHMKTSRVRLAECSPVMLGFFDDLFSDMAERG